MKKSFLTTFSLLMLLSMTTFSAFAQETEKQMQNMYSDFLDDRGIENWVDSDGDVQFKYEGKTYFFDVDEDDPTFFRVVLFNIWPIESEKERIQALKAMDYANNKVKVAKIYSVNENIWVGVEGFRNDIGEFEGYFDRCMNVISTCVDYFVEEMEG